MLASPEQKVQATYEYAALQYLVEYLIQIGL
jgi:hypothetical protein